jgi:hypothetical protein
VRGAEQKVETYSEAEAETATLPDAREREALRADAFGALEARGADAAAARGAAPSLRALLDARAHTSRDDYSINKALRRALRAQRGEAARADAERAAVGLPESIPLLPAAPEDTLAAQAVTFRRVAPARIALDGGFGGAFGDDAAKRQRLLAIVRSRTSAPARSSGVVQVQPFAKRKAS